MPVMSNQGEAKPRQSGRSWFLLPPVLLVLLLSLLAVPLFQPICLVVGPWTVLAGTVDVPEMDVVLPANAVVAPDGNVYSISGPYHDHEWSVGNRLVYLTWFRGKRLK